MSPPLRLVPVVALLTALALTGCLDGTTRTPPEAAGVGRMHKHSRQLKRAAAGATVSIAAVGDTALGIAPTLPSDPAAYLDPVKPELTGDVVFGNLEGTLTDVSESPKCGPESSECFAFRAPPEYARYLAQAGFTLMSDANNHSFDFGEAGEEETIQALRRVGIEQTGLPGEITTVPAAGRRIAFVGFAPYPNTASLTDLDAAQDLIQRADRKADIVVAAIHAGAEGTDAQHVTGTEETYLGEDRGNPEEYAHMAIDAGADLVLGSGPHVLRGMEIYRRRLIAYSLGNFSGYHNFMTEGALGVSAVLHVTLAADGSFRAGRIVSIRLVEAGQPAPDPEAAAADEIALLSREDFGSDGVEMGKRGCILARPYMSTRSSRSCRGP
jgi:poly-gamma-glutamate capsule biosynthesis protein CapA/YwtB (metallophosphatase superfamily)